MKFNVNVKHVPGKQLVIADVLRRSPIPHDERVVQQAQKVELHAHSIQGRCFVSMNRQSKYKFETSAAQDSSLKQIAHFILYTVGQNRQQLISKLMRREKGELSVNVELITLRNES